MTDQNMPLPVPLDDFSDVASRRRREGARFAGLFATAQGNDTRLVAGFAQGDTLTFEQAIVPQEVGRYPSLVSHTPGALWYEREIHDLFGVRSTARDHRDPLVIALSPHAHRPRLGSGDFRPDAALDLSALPIHLRGEGVFTISYGPVRSGVFESIEYVVETPGEDIPHLGIRISYKHRGVESRFEGLSVDNGVLLSERYEGVASVAHALAFCGAIEQIGDIVVPRQASLVRVLHAELERVSNHLDSTTRHCEAAGQAVAFARFSTHKEHVQRLRGQLCGSRFGRGVVVPGGVAASPTLSVGQLLAVTSSLQADIEVDVRLLMSTPSFLDRLRGTGVLSEETVRRYGALGPLARGSGFLDDVRFTRPYAAYGTLGGQRLDVRRDGDALSRQRVRVNEIEESFSLIDAAMRELAKMGEPDGAKWAEHVGDLSGEAVGWAEAPQGEVLTWVQVRDGRLTRVKPRSASFHNLALFPMAFPKDILTDFAFIEASFGLSIAGAAG